LIPLTEAIISNSVAAHSGSSLFNLPAAVQSGSGSFASTCASLLSSTTTNGAPIPSGADSKQSPKPGSGIVPAGGAKAKTKDAQKDNSVGAAANSVAPGIVPTLVAQVTQTSLPPALIPGLPISSALNSAFAVASLALGSTPANVPFQGPDSLQVTLNALATTKQDAVGNVAPQALTGGTPVSALAFSFPSLPQPSPLPSPQLNKAEASRPALVNQDASVVAGGALAKAPQTSSDSVSANNNPLPQEIRLRATNSNSITGNGITVLAATPSGAVNQVNATNVPTIPAILRSDSATAGGGMPLSSYGAVPSGAVPPGAAPQNVTKVQDAARSLSLSGATLGVNAPQQNTKQENVTATNVTARMVRPAENQQAGHQPVTAAVPSTPSDPQHSGKPNVTSAGSVPNAPNKLAAPSNVSAELRNGSTLSNPTSLAAPSTAANIPAIPGSIALPLPPANGSNTAGTTSIPSKDNHATSSGPLAASPTTTPQSNLSNKDSSNNVSQAAGPVHDAAAQPIHGNSIPPAVQPVLAQSGALQPFIVSAPVDAGRQPAPSHSATSESVPKQSSGNLPTSPESAHLMSNASESQAALTMGPVQIAQIASKATQAEMRIGLNTSAFGNVEVRTVIHASEVGLVIGSERGDLRSLLGSEIPGIANTLQQQNLRLNEVNFHQGFTSSSNSSSGGDSQPRSFTPPAVPAHYPLAETRGDHSIESVMTETPGLRHTGLNILA
jgi:hypothetical protein